MTKRVIRGISGMILMLVAGIGHVSAQCTVDLQVNVNQGNCGAQVFLTSTASDPVQQWNYFIDGQLVSTNSSVLLSLGPGVYQAYVGVITDQNCTATDLFTFTVTGNLPTVDAGSDILACQSQAQLSASVNSTNAYSVNWTPSAYLDDPTSLTPTIMENVTNQWFIVDVVDNVTGCVNSDTVYVTQQNPIIETYDLCSGSATIDLGAGANNYDWLSWTDTSGTNHPLNYPATQHVITVTEPGQYFAVAYFQECGALTSLVTVEACPQTCWNAFTQNIFPDQCGDLYEFVSTGTGQLTSWSWDFGDGTTSPFPNPYHIFTTGTYEVTLTTTDTDGCTAVSSMTFSSNNGVSLSMSNDTIGCQEAGYMEVFPTGGSGDYSYEWTPTQGTFSDPTQPIFYVEGVHEQVYYAYVTDNVTGCVAYDSVTVSSYVAHNETLELCNDSVFVNLGPGAQFYNLSPFSFDPNSQYAWVTDTGDYVFYAIFPNCGALTSTYSIQPCPQTCVSTITSTLNYQNCGAVVNLIASYSTPIDSAIWDLGNGNVVVDYGTGVSPVFYEAGSYLVQLTAYHSNGCVSTTSHSIILLTQVNVNITEDSVACNGTLPLSATVSGGSGQYAYFWHPSSAINTPTSPTPLLTVTQNTWVVLELTDQFTGCTVYDSSYVFANLPVNEVLQLCSDSLLLDVDPGSMVYQWSFTDQFGNTTQIQNFTNSVWADEVGIYSCFTYYSGCTGITHYFEVHDCTTQNGEVWPGDANSDNIVTNADALYLGLAFNQTGPVRPAATLNWIGQPCPDWNFNFAQNNVNLKHADCDGNGIINFDDTLAISFNYLNTHNKTEGATAGGNPPIWVEAMPDTVGLEQAIDIVVYLGTVSQPVDSLHGVAFSLTFNESLVTQNGLMVDFANCALGTAGSDVLTFQKNLFSDGLLDLAITRNTLVNFQGYGPIVHARIVTTDNLSGITELPIGVTGVFALTAEEAEVQLTAIGDTIVIDPNKVGIEENDLENVLIYPNPTSDILNIVGLASGGKISILNAMGQEVMSMTYQATEKVQLDMSQLNTGVYFVRIESEKSILVNHVRLIR